MRLPLCASSLRLRLLYAQPPPLLCGRASASQRSLVASLPPPQTPEKRRRLLVLLQLSSGVKATGGRAESERVAHVFDFPTRARCVDVHAIVSDAVKGSHVQRGPLSMGAQSEPGTGISKSKKGERLCRLTLWEMQQRKWAHSWGVGSYSCFCVHLPRTNLLAQRASPP